MRPIKKWKHERRMQILRRVSLFLFVIILLCGAFFLGCSITYEQVSGKAYAGHIDDIHPNGLYAGVTDEDWLAYDVDVVKEEQEIVGSEIDFIGYDDTDYQMLAKLIYLETGGQGWDCMVACGSVVMNRIQSDKYPNTLEDVIFQNGQYSVTRNRHRFWLTEPSEDAYMVAELVLTCGSQIPSNVMFQGQSRTIGSGIWKIIRGEAYCYE